MRAIGYARVSTTEQAESGLGLDAQVQAIRAAAGRLGAELVTVCQDAGVSGAASMDKRPGLLEAVAALGRGDVLMVAKRDRLGRDVVGVALIERLVARKGARVLSAAGEGTEQDGPTGELMRTIVDAFGQYERALIATRTRVALRAKRARGERAGAVPFGFRAESGGRLVEEPAEQGVISAVRQARARGLSHRDIVAELQEEGHRSRSGKPLGKTQVARILAARVA